MQCTTKLEIINQLKKLKNIGNCEINLTVGNEDETKTSEVNCKIPLWIVDGQLPE